MADHVYKTVDLTGTSSESIEQAVQTAISRASGTIRNVKWFEVTQVRGAVDNGKVAQWQVALKVSFTLEG